MIDSVKGFSQIKVNSNGCFFTSNIPINFVSIPHQSSVSGPSVDRFVGIVPKFSKIFILSPKIQQIFTFKPKKQQIFILKPHKSAKSSYLSPINQQIFTFKPHKSAKSSLLSKKISWGLCPQTPAMCECED